MFFLYFNTSIVNTYKYLRLVKLFNEYGISPSNELLLRFLYY